jgi:phytanoyl-CoA hydroxylase
MIRRLKLTYALYNFFHKEELKHNIPNYRKYGLAKKYYSPISSLDFKHLPQDKLVVDSEKLYATNIYKQGDLETKEQIENYSKTGYIVLKNFLSDTNAENINKEINDLLEQKRVTFKYGNKIMFALHHSQLLRDTGKDEKLIELLNVLIDGKAKLFQSINFLSGSEQDTHSDSIHMTTYPLGGLLGVWIALEDIDETNGALHYYPGSQNLPYYLNEEYDNVGTKFLIGDKDYTAYEKMLQEKIATLGLQKEIFRAKKGDVLIWHANLMHGGEAHTDKSKSRKSMVFHYFKEGSICYHELTQRPALMRVE